MADDTHAFISYAHVDAAWVHTLADNLHQSGLKVWIDRWGIAPGDNFVGAIEQGLRTARHGVLVVTPAALERPWVREEYEVMLRHAVDSGRRLIPVMYRDAELPLFLANRQWVDFRGVDGPAYFGKLDELVAALKGERPSPPPLTGERRLPAGAKVRPEGKLCATLRFEDGKTTLAGDFGVVEAAYGRIDAGLEQLLWQHGRRLHGNPDLLMRGAGQGSADGGLAELGQKLGQAFLAEPVGSKLAERIGRAQQLNVSLELALEIADPALAALPFEVLTPPVPGARALVLDPSVNLFRRIQRDGPATAIQLPAPLRILVAIGSPEAQNPRGELLDMEAELRRILDAIEGARQKGAAMVRILERGSVAAIRQALEQQRYHVLYISCHARPGELVLENLDGREDRVSARRLWEEALVRDRGVPLVLLAGCSTALAGGPEEGEEALPGFARTLVEQGVPAVLAMQAPVTDRYATVLAGAIFEALATGQEPEPLRAFAEARRALERERLRDTSARQPIAEWSTPALYAAVSPQRLIDPEAEREALAAVGPSRCSIRASWCAGSATSSAAGARSGWPSSICGTRMASAWCCMASAGSARAASPQTSCTASRSTAGCWSR